MRPAPEQDTWLATLVVGLEDATDRRWEVAYATDGHGETMRHLAELRLPVWPASTVLRSRERTYVVSVFFDSYRRTATVKCPGVDVTSRIGATPTVAVRRVASGLEAAVRAWERALMDDRSDRARAVRTEQYARELASVLGGSTERRRCTYSGEEWSVYGDGLRMDVRSDSDSVHISHAQVTREEASAIAEALAGLRAERSEAA